MTTAEPTNVGSAVRDVLRHHTVGVAGFELRRSPSAAVLAGPYRCVFPQVSGMIAFAGVRESPTLSAGSCDQFCDHMREQQLESRPDLT